MHLATVDKTEYGHLIGFIVETAVITTVWIAEYTTVMVPETP